jgi:hypothetical protein
MVYMLPILATWHAINILRGCNLDLNTLSQPQVAQSIQDNKVSKTPYFRYIFNLRYNMMKFTSMV